MKSFPAFIAATALALAPAALPSPQDGVLRKSGTDYLERTRGKRVVFEFEVQSSMAVGFLGQIGWVGLYEPGGRERVGISNFSGTPLKASVAAEPGVYDAYVLSQASASRRKFIRSIDARAFQPGDIIPVTLAVSGGWDGTESAGTPSNSATTRTQPADDAQRRIEEAQRAAELRAGRKPVESATQSAPAPQKPAAPPSAPVKPAPPAQTQQPPQPQPAAGSSARGTFSLKIFEGYRFSDGATVKSDDKSSDIRFYYLMRNGSPYVYLGADKIAELSSAPPARFPASQTASWKDYVFAPGPGYFGVVSKGRAYLVHLDTYENQGKAATYWKMNFSWQALN